VSTTTKDPHCWKTPQTPRGMPPSAWPEKRRKLYVEAIDRDDPTVPIPVHQPGTCAECDLMRDLLREERRDAPAQPALQAAVAPTWLPEWLGVVIQRLGGIRAFPGTVALLLGMMAGVGLCTIVGPGWAVAVVMVLATIAFIAAY
jgi:hypothetical protein